MKNFIGYSEFIRIFKIKDPKEFLVPGVEVRIDGVWVVPPSDDTFLFPEERAVLSEHPKKDLTKPALSFPCTLEQLEVLLEFFGIRDCVEVKEFAKMQEGPKQKANTETGYKISHHADPIPRDEAQERNAWEKRIQPLLKKCGLNFDFQFIEGDYKEIDTWRVTKLACDVCNGLQSGFKNVFDILIAIKEGRSVKQVHKDCLGGFFHKILVDDKILFPAFIGLVLHEKALSVETEEPFDAGAYFDPLQPTPTQKSGQSNARLEMKSSSAEPIERNQLLEKALWLKHIDPIIKTHNLKTIRGEHFQYRYFDKCIDNKGVDSMLRQTMSICRSIVFPKAGVPAEKSNNLYGGADCFITEIVCRLRDAEKGPQIFNLKDGGKIDLKDTFRNFLSEIFENQTLPEFLELLRCEIPVDKNQADQILSASTELNLNKIALAARANGYIDEIALAEILAFDDQYKEMIPELWHRFDLKLRNQLPDLRNFSDRRDTWYKILLRWITGTVSGAPVSKSIKRLEYRRGEPGYIELDALKNFFDRWQIPLPQQLYGNNQQIETQPTQILPKQVANINVPGIDSDIENRPSPFSLIETGHISENSIDQLILEYGKAAERLYQCICRRLSAENKSLTHAEKEDLKTAAFFVFNENPKSFYPLKIGHLEGDALYIPTEKQKRSTIGMILRNALMNNPSTGSDYQRLYNRYLTLKKSASPTK